jgi:hypothetical protein
MTLYILNCLGGKRRVTNYCDEEEWSQNSSQNLHEIINKHVLAYVCYYSFFFKWNSYDSYFFQRYKYFLSDMLTGPRYKWVGKSTELLFVTGEKKMP